MEFKIFDPAREAAATSLIFGATRSIAPPPPPHYADKASVPRTMRPHASRFGAFSPQARLYEVVELSGPSGVAIAEGPVRHGARARCGRSFAAIPTAVLIEISSYEDGSA